MASSISRLMMKTVFNNLHTDSQPFC